MHNDRNTSASGLPKGVRAALAACLLAAAGLILANELPLDTQEKLLREQAVDAVMRNDAVALFEAMDEFRTLASRGTAVPAGLYFAEADSARSNGRPVRAERAFNDYFRVAPAEGAAFAEAMQAYGEFRKSIPEAAWPILELMEPVSGGVMRVGALQREVRVAPFSLSRQRVTRGQFEAFVAATDYRMPGDETPGDCLGSAADGAEPATGQSASDPVVCVSWRDAAAYLAWLNEQSGLTFRLPRADELDYAMQAPEPTAGLSGTGREWVGDCAASSIPTRSNAAGSAEPPCSRRVAVATMPRDRSSAVPGDHRSVLDEGHRASNLGFRLAMEN